MAGYALQANDETLLNTAMRIKAAHDPPVRATVSVFISPLPLAETSGQLQQLGPSLLAELADELLELVDVPDDVHAPCPLSFRRAFDVERNAVALDEGQLCAAMPGSRHDVSLMNEDVAAIVCDDEAEVPAVGRVEPLHGSGGHGGSFFAVSSNSTCLTPVSNLEMGMLIVPTPTRFHPGGRCRFPPAASGMPL